MLRRRLVAVLGKGGLSVAPPASALFGDPEPVTPYRIRVVVAAMNLKLCVAGLGIGEKKPSGGQDTERPVGNLRPGGGGQRSTA